MTRWSDFDALDVWYDARRLGLTDVEGAARALLDWLGSWRFA